jgi:hypothetical protein
MSNAINIIKGLQIIQDNKPSDENDYHVRAEHDEIIAGGNWIIHGKDKGLLEGLGWEWIEEYEGWRYSV